MSDAVRGLMVLLSVLLWSPSLQPLVDGQISLEEGALRYLAAAAIAWAGCAGLTALIRGYTPDEPAADDEAEPTADGRGDASETSDRPLRRAQDAPS